MLFWPVWMNLPAYGEKILPLPLVLYGPKRHYSPLPNLVFSLIFALIPMRALFFFLFSAILSPLPAQHAAATLTSPDQSLRLQVSLDASGVPHYSLSRKGKVLIGASTLGLLAKEADFSRQLRHIKSTTARHDETWKPVWGEEDAIRDRHNALQYEVENPAGQHLTLEFRLFNDGLGFRYALPAMANVAQLTVLKEFSAFQMNGDHTAWWAPSDWDSNEHTYTKSALSAIDATKYQNEIEPFNQFIPDIHAVQTPVTMRAADGLHLVIAEAAQIDYGALHLKINPKTQLFSAFIVPTPDSAVISVNKLPFHTPWRVVLVNRSAAGLLKNRVILNLNEPCKITGDLSWIKPQKMVGVWWEMHVGKGSWDYSEDPDLSTSRKPHGRHSANTANVKKYIDFASKYGFDGVLVEGWNEGWEDWFNQRKEEVFDFTKPYPDYDIDALSQYAKEKGVKIIMHHETSGAVPSYERQMEAAYDYMNKYGMDAVKTGYVGYLFPKGEWHDGQWMSNHYIRVAEATARHHVMLDAHEPSRPSGLHRTWPNWLASEAARGGEYNAWSKGNTPEHVLMLPFTRILGGPMDYTPGIFETRMNVYDKNKKEIVHSTVANQLALYVTLYSPLQMAADLPENYEKRLDVFQFIRDVPVDWSATKVLNASIGEYMTVARRQKGSANWFLGSITNEQPRQLKAKLDFLDAGKIYDATIYADGKDAHYKDNPYPVTITQKKVRKGDTLTLSLAAGGGCAVSIKAK